MTDKEILVEAFYRLAIPFVETSDTEEGDKKQLWIKASRPHCSTCVFFEFAKDGKYINQQSNVNDINSKLLFGE